MKCLRGKDLKMFKVLKYVRECPTCQQNKDENSYPARLLQPLPISNQNGSASLRILSQGFQRFRVRIMYMW